jgi:putative transposase
MVRSLGQREAAKAAELTAAGEPTSAKTVQRLRLRYRAQGLLGLVDRRAMRPVRPLGNADPRLVAAIVAQLDRETTQSTGTRGRLR